MATDSDGSCLKYLNIGDPNREMKGFTNPEDVVDWFHEDRSDDWRQRD